MQTGSALGGNGKVEAYLGIDIGRRHDRTGPVDDEPKQDSAVQ
jgi:hypothetical protein